jgi:subtilisin-like proprotein convertase family protein
MQRKRILYLLAILALLAAMLPVGVTAQGEAPVAPLQIEMLQPQLDASEGDKPAAMTLLPDGAGSMLAPDGMALFSEIEPNGTPATATALPSNDTVAVGNIYPNGDLDYFSFTGAAGDRVYAATMTSFSASGSVDSYLTLFGTDGTTIIEFDNDDGSFGTTSSSIAGATLPSAGTYYLQVRHNSATSQLRPYRLHLRVQSGAPVAETESNDTPATANPLPPSGWVSGNTSSAVDFDYFSLSLNAGDSVYLSLDLDPERDTVEWNAQLGLGVFNNFVLVVNDAGTATPDSEAFFMTVKDAGTYYVLVSAPTGGTTFGTYNLSASVIPKQQQANCTTYTSTDVPKVIPSGPGMVSSTLVVPGNPRIADIDVSIALTHTFMQDLDAHLVSPAGNDNGLFTDVGNATVGSPNIQMNTTLDDEAAIPIGQFQVVSGPSFTPELNYRLSWYDYTDAGGTWTLKLYDDATGDGGILQSWSVTICEPPPPPTCPVGYNPVTVYSSDFEADDGGFTHSGAQDEWERGLPTFTPLTTCNSGVNCWVTDLDQTYNASSDQTLLSPAIDLSGYSGPVILRWAQRYHMESASFDGAYAQVQEVGGANPTRLWTWLDATMNNTVGNPTTTIAQSAGWGQRWADISPYAGQNIEALFNLNSDTTVQLAGLAIDDVSVTACQQIPSNPAITLDKTVGTDDSVCAVTDQITLPYGGGDVTYCYEVTNTGDVTLTRHDLVDSELGALLTNFPYSLAPGASAFITETTNIGVTTVNTATWTAYNPTDGFTSASATDMATVTVDGPMPAIVLTKTVGTDPLACATTDDITVPANTDVTYCYEVTNTGNVPLNSHDLTDSELGALLTNFSYVLAPGASVFVTETATIAVTTVNTATWSAEETFLEGGNPSAWATDMATVTVQSAIGPAIVLTKTVGTDPLVCATTDVLTVPAGTEVTYCYEVENTGDVTLNLHDLDDSELGSLLSGFSYALAPGASAFITESATINVTTVNTATWTAYNSGVGVGLCNTPNLAIPDNNPSGVSNTLNVPTGGAISDLNVALDITHTWVGDLILTLQHVDTGTTVTILNRVGATSGTAGCSGNDIDNTADDEAALSFENNCTFGANPTQAYIAGQSYQGGDPASSTLLAAFDGESLAGAWTLTVSDNAGLDTGTLNEWCLLSAGSGETASASDTATVNVEQGDPPNIDVDPLSMSATQQTNTTTQQTLNVENTGGGTLDWEIDEENITAFPQGPAVVDPASAFEDASAAAAPGAPEAAPEKVEIWRAPDVVLFDNGPLVNFPGGGAGGADESRLQSASLSMTTLGFGHQVLNNNWIADDFTVSDAGGWTVDSATFFAYQTNSTTASTMTTVNWILYNGDPSAGGTVITSGSGLQSTAWANIYRTTETTIGVTNRPIMATTVNMGGLPLAAGTYWLAWQTDGTLASGPWAPPITINGQAVTGNGLQSLGGTAAWAPANDGGTGTPRQGFPFILEGTVGGGGDPCSAVSDIPWLSLDVYAGSNAGGTDTDVTATFDSTGLLAGVYTGNLCVTSNDPDAGPGNGTDLVIVPVTLTVEPPTAVTLSGLAATGETAPAQAPLPLAGLPLAALPAALGLALGAAYVLRRKG